MLLARSDWKSQLVCLGFAGRSVTVDPARRLVRIRIRRFWFVTTSTVIVFDRVLYVLSGYRDWSFSNLSVFGAYRDRGVYTVELRLKTGERVLLFRFYSEGDFINEGFVPDFLYWDDYVDAAVTKIDQSSEAEAFARLVAGLVGVPIKTD